jgi:hypothetical protein
VHVPGSSPPTRFLRDPRTSLGAPLTAANRMYNIVDEPSVMVNVHVGAASS